MISVKLDSFRKLKGGEVTITLTGDRSSMMELVGMYDKPLGLAIVDTDDKELMAHDNVVHVIELIQAMLADLLDEVKKDEAISA